MAVAVDLQMEELLDELCDLGCTPEQVCAACPELLPEVRRRWLQMCAVKADLDALLPTPGSDAVPGADTSVPWHAGDELPQIPGYEVEALLGRGGMGLVYKARHLRLNRLVAIKMLITGAYAGPHERARFQRRRRRRPACTTPTSCRSTTWGTTPRGGRTSTDVELLEGGSLSQAAARHAAAGRPGGVALVATLAEAVQVAAPGRDRAPRPEAGQHLPADGRGHTQGRRFRPGAAL